MARIVLVFAALTILAAPAFAKTAKTAKPSKPSRPAETPGTFTLEHALTMRSIADPVWSADGKKLAFVVTSVDTVENQNNQDLWLLDVAERDARQLTRNPKNDFSPTFSPGGDTIAFITTRGTGDDVKPAIYMLSLRGGEPWAFGSYDEGVGEVSWSPDGRWLAYVKTDTLPKRIREWRKKKWDQVIEDERLQYPSLWVVEVATGKQRRLTSGRYVWYARWSPDSREIAFLVSPTGKPDDGNLADIGIVSVDGGAVRTLNVIGSEFTWSPDGRWIAWANGSDRNSYVGKSDLWVIPPGGGRPTKLTGNFDEDAKTPAWSPDSRLLYFHAARGASSALATVPRAGGGVGFSEDLAADAGTPVIARDGKVAWIQSGPQSPAEVWVADRAGDRGRAMSGVNGGVATLALGTTRTVQWTSTDGERIEGVLLRPHGAAEKAALRTLVLLHGGPYAARYALSFQSVPQYFAAHGYQVFMPNFRSSGGYGTAFMLRKRADWGGQDWQDVMTGIDSLVKWRLADANKLAVYGGSYGGYLSAWAITQTHRFKAACVIAGAVDLGAHFGQSDIHKYRAYDFEGPPWKTPQNWTKSSPITYIEKAKTPTQILIGESDPRVPYPQGQELYAALTTLHVPVEFVHYPREGHGLREPRHRADQLMRMLAWFDRWVK
jgi:dipeptidyl aminopeptidase/acylaminoacyl peptidase